MPLLVSWSSDSAGVMYGARGPSGDVAGYHRETISSRAFTPGTHGSGRELSMSHTEAVPTGYGPVGSGRYGVGPRPAGTSPASAGNPMPPIITARPRAQQMSGLMTEAPARPGHSNPRDLHDRGYRSDAADRPPHHHHLPRRHHQHLGRHAPGGIRSHRSHSDHSTNARPRRLAWGRRRGKPVTSFG